MKEEQVFGHMGYLPFAGSLMILLGLPLPLIAILLQRQEAYWPGFFLINALGLLVMGMGLFFVVRFNGRFHLTAHSISRTRFGRTTTLHLHEIIRLEKRDSQLIPYLRLHTTTSKMDITAQVRDFTTLETLLRAQLTHLPDEPVPTLPFTLRLPMRFYLGNLIPLLLLALFISGLLLFANANGGQADVPGLLAFLGGFLGLIVFAVVLAENGNPYKLVLGETAVTAHYLHKTRTIPLSDIQQIGREKHISTYKGIERITYPIVIIVKNGKKWRIEEKRIWTFGYTPEELLRLMQHFYDPQQSANRLIALGNQYHQQGAYEQAITAYQQAIDLYPAYHSYRLVIGDMLHEQKRYREAIRVYRDLLNALPQHDQAWHSLGMSLLAVGQWQQAGDAFDQALAFGTTDATLYYGALAYARQQQPERARAYLEQAIQFNAAWRNTAQQEPYLKDLL
ncbi:MAG: tetratricopeptide repeat protein [Chloroflexota bacterium]